MSVLGSVRTVARKFRPAVHAVPGVGHGLRYTKRLILLPWNFHKLFAAWSAHPPEATAATAINAALHASGDIQNTVWQATQNVAHVAVGQSWLAAEHVRDTLAAQLRLAAEDIRCELKRLNSTHADCYDRLHESGRDQARELAKLAETVAELAVKVQSLESRGHAGPHLHANGSFRKAG
jgi:hypothetical protein